MKSHMGLQNLFLYVHLAFRPANGVVLSQHFRQSTDNA